MILGCKYEWFANIKILTSLALKTFSLAAFQMQALISLLSRKEQIHLAQNKEVKGLFGVLRQILQILSLAVTINAKIQRNKFHLSF